MKKNIAILLTTVLMLSCFSMAVSAKVGDVIGQALHTDIVAYINHYAIPSYAVNGQSVIVAEDLRNFGFDVTWDGYSRTLTISRNGSPWVTPMDFKKDSAFGKKFTNILQTDIKVYANGKQIKSYAMNGYTMIPMEELTMFGEVYWVANERAIKLWVDGLTIRSTKQAPEIKYPNTSKTYSFAFHSSGPGWQNHVTYKECLKIDSVSSYQVDNTFYVQGPATFTLSEFYRAEAWNVPAGTSIDDFTNSYHSSMNKYGKADYTFNYLPKTFTLPVGTYIFAFDIGGIIIYYSIIVS